jgi:hypothetical protein
MSRTRVFRDPLLPNEDDYPTGPIDLTDMSDPYVRALVEDVTIDELGLRHSNATGQFVSKRVDYSHLVVHPDVPGVDRPFTWAEYEALPKGPEVADHPPVTVYTVPRHPDVEPVIRRPQEFDDSPGVSLDMVSVCCAECVYGPTEKVEPRRQSAREGGGKKTCVYVRKSDRLPCTEKTYYTDSAGRAACHYHGGVPR